MLSPKLETNSQFLCKKLGPYGVAPSRKSELAAGFDIFSAEECVIPSQGSYLLSTQIAVSIPLGYYGRIAPRSGLALKFGIDVGAGVIDADYRGEIKVLLFNHSKSPYTVHIGDRCCQLILTKISPVTKCTVVQNLDKSSRNDSGFGSTGK